MYEEFLVLGLILFAGFGADILFERTRISQVLLLMALGFLLGPLLGIVDSNASEALASLAPFIGSLALMIMLFDGGINLNLFEIARAIPKATLFTITTFALTMVSVSALSYLVLGWSLWWGLLLGAVVGGTSSAIVLALTRNAQISAEAKNLLTIESTITDALCIVAAIVLIQLISAKVPLEPLAVINMLLSAFSVAIIAGVIAAVAWLAILERLGKASNSYMLTIGSIALLFAIVEAMHGNGGIAIFSFGLVLGNAERLTKFFGMPPLYKLERKIANFQDEVTFFTRTFFFVYLGLIINLEGITVAIAAFSLGLLAVFYLCRRVSLKLVFPASKDTKYMASMLPRGLAAAVLAGMPAASGIIIPDFAKLAFIAIISTNIIATVATLGSGGSPAVEKEVNAAKRLHRKR